MLPGCIILRYILTLEKLNLLSQSSELKFKNSLKIKFIWFSVGYVNVTFLIWEMYLEKFHWENEIAFSESSSETVTQKSYSAREELTAFQLTAIILAKILSSNSNLHRSPWKGVHSDFLTMATPTW